MYLPQPAVAADQGIGGAVVCERRLLSAFQLRDDVAGQHLAQLHAPLIEGVNVPDGALREDAVLIEGHECAERLRRQPLGENGARWPVAFEGAVWHQPFRCAFSLDLFRGFAKARAMGLAKAFASKRSWCRPSGLRVWQKAMKSQGTSLVPWCISW